jgi:hypothetical protein
MKTVLCILSFAFAFVSILLLARSQALDEGIEYRNYIRVADNTYSGHVISFGWGANGIRLFRANDSGMLKIPRESRGSIYKSHSMIGVKFRTWSVSHDDVTPWVWGVTSFWNSYGFWHNDNTWDSDDSSRGQISIVAIPLWLPSVFFFLIGLVLLRIRRRATNRQNKPRHSNPYQPPCLHDLP